MQSHDKPRFAEIVRAAHEVHGRKLSPDAVSIWWNILKPYPIEAVERGLVEVLRGSQFPPKPADVIEALNVSDGRPTADEAWQYAIALMDEDTTGWSNREIDRAWGVARTIYRDGDKVGARVAFREAYNRAVDEARGRQEPVKWRLSLGQNPDERVEKVREAEAAGLLSHEQARGMLGHDPVPAEQAQALLEGPASSPEAAREWLSTMKRRVGIGTEENDAEGAAGAEE